MGVQQKGSTVLGCCFRGPCELGSTDEAGHEAAGAEGRRGVFHPFCTSQPCPSPIHTGRLRCSYAFNPSTTASFTMSRDNHVRCPSTETHRKEAATLTAVPEVQVVSIEHPCIVKIFDNGFKSLGGEQQLKHILDDDSDNDRPRKAQKGGQSAPVVGLSWRPQDPLAKKLESTPTDAQNILVKVTLPKWTGRKRKRGSNGPFADATTGPANHEISAPDLIRRLQDNASKYRVEAVGKVETSHRFNSLPDLHARDCDVQVMRELGQHAMTPNYDVLKNFHIDLTPGTVGITALPRPPYFIPPDLQPDDPFGTHAAPEPTIQKPPKVYNRQHLVYKPDAEVPAELKSYVDTLSAFFEKRPIASRLVLQNTFPDIAVWRLDLAATWIGSKSKGGPWRDCIIKHGLDPASDPQYRMYQVVSIRSPGAKSKEEDSGSHVFDGVTKTKGRTFQLCDITDPVLASIINTPHFRSGDEGYGGSTFGWYHNGTIAKLKVLLPDKVKRMQSPSMALDDRAYKAIAALPENIDESSECELDGAVFGEEARNLGMLVKKEALRMARGSGEIGPAEENGEETEKGLEGAEDELEGAGGVGAEMAIDPALADGGSHSVVADPGGSLAAAGGAESQEAPVQATSRDVEGTR